MREINGLEEKLIVIKRSLGDDSICPDEVEDKLEWYLDKIIGLLSKEDRE